MAYMRKTNGPTVRCPIPTGPLMRIVDQWISENGGFLKTGDSNSAGRRMTAVQQLSLRCGRKDMVRTLTRMREEQEYTSVDVADSLICATYGPQLWHTEPELKAAVEWLDAQQTFCPDCWSVTTACECELAA